MVPNWRIWAVKRRTICCLRRGAWSALGPARACVCVCVCVRACAWSVRVHLCACTCECNLPCKGSDRGVHTSVGTHMSAWCVHETDTGELGMREEETLTFLPLLTRDPNWPPKASPLPVPRPRPRLLLGLGSAKFVPPGSTATGQRCSRSRRLAGCLSRTREDRSEGPFSRSPRASPLRSGAEAPSSGGSARLGARGDAPLTPTPPPP